MKIAIFSDTFFPQVNGVANVAFQSAQALSALGHEVMVFVPMKKSERKRVEDVVRFKIVYIPSFPVFLYPGERIVSPFGISIWKHLTKFRPDIIHTHTPFIAGWVAVCVAKILKIKLIGTHHTFFDYYLKHIWMDFAWARKLSWKYTVYYYNRCDVVLSPTISLRDDLILYGFKKPIQILVNAVDTDLFHSVTFDEKQMLKKQFGIPGISLVYMGRLSYEKSINVVINAFAQILEKNNAVTLVIVGGGPEKNKLQELVTSLHISDRVIFTGILRDTKLAEALQANDIFITASKSENMPLSILEGKACGLPVIAVAEKGISEIISDGVDGFLSPADDILAMSQNIMKLLDNKDVLSTMSNNSRKNALEYSEEKVTNSLIEIYTSILHENKN